MICAKHACSTGSQYCSSLRTTSPPRIDCTSTPPTAVSANQRSHLRPSFRQITTVSTSSSPPTTPAITRCECSKNAPPTSCRSEGNHVPNDFGQSGTESAAALEVTNAPATNNRTVQSSTNSAKRYTPG